MFLGRMVTVLFGATEAGAALVVDKLGLVSFEDSEGRGDLVSVGGDDDAVDGT